MEVRSSVRDGKVANIIALFEVTMKDGKNSDYKITVVTPLRSYTLTERTSASTDSNHHLEGRDMYYISKYHSPIGGITLASNGTELTGLWFDGQKYFADNLPAEYEEKDLPVFGQAKKWLDIYFSGKMPGFTPPLSMDGISPFRRRVWEIMMAIPFGQTSTYGKIAKQIETETGKKVSAQAVGGAVGHNSISLIIPCHRVIGTNGSLTGYAGGLDKKVKLLKMEGVNISGLTVPKI